jgi:hypothetical protein
MKDRTIVNGGQALPNQGQMLTVVTMMQAKAAKKLAMTNEVRQMRGRTLACDRMMLANGGVKLTNRI